MISRFHRLWAITSTLLCLAALSYSQEEEFEATLSTPVVIDTNTGDLVATDNAQLTYGDWLVSADEIRLNQQTNRAIATGKVVFTRGDIRLVADLLDYQVDEQRARIENFRVGNGKYFVSGAVLEGNPDNFRFTDIDFHPGEPGTYLFKARADQLALIDQNEIQGERLSFKLGVVPFFIIPSISQPIDAERNIFKANLDYSGHIGGAIGGEARVPLNSNFRVGANLVLTTKRGILAGPAFEYDFGDQENPTFGSFTSGYIDDDASEIRPDLITGNPIDDERFFAEWQHRQNWGDNGALTAYGRWWSDPEITREFYEDSFDIMQDPDTYLEANYSGNNWQTTVFSRISPNDFQSFTERLPEVRFDLFPTTLAKGLTHSGSLSFARLKNQRAVNLPIESEANRANAYYGFRYTKPLKPGITLTTKVGVKAIHYFDNMVGSEAGDSGLESPFRLTPLSLFDDYTHFFPRPSIKKGTRGYGDFGVDLKFTAYSQSDYKNEIWNIDGLRHIFEPVISYRFVPDLDSAAANAIHDVPAFSNYLTPIDLEDRRDIDTIGEHHVTRMQFRNRIQTRDKEYGSRDLARLDFSVDYLVDDYGLGVDFSDFVSDLEITPVQWLEIDFFSRWDFENSFIRELNTSYALTDPRYWKLGIGNHFLKGQLDQYFIFGEYNLNENHKVYAVAKFDEKSDTFYEQRIGFMQRALEKYGIKYELRIYEGNRRESDFGIRIGIDLFDE